MKIFKLSILTDCFFIFISSFFISYGIIRYNFLQTLPSLLLSIILSVLCSFIYLVISYQKSQSNLIKEGEKSRIENLLLELCFMENKEVLNLFEKCYNKMQKSVVKEENHLILQENKCQVFIKFTFEPTTSNDVIKSYKQTKKGFKTIFIANNYTKEALELVESLSLRIQLFSLNDAYLSLKECNLLPSSTFSKKVKIKNTKGQIKGIFVKSNGKKALFLGIFIMCLSPFSYFTAYYLIIGCALLILAVFLRFFAKPNPTQIKGIKNL